ncbi:hypothetical protein AMECASPLE_035909 [Ameca splendens]|uniref:Uncharacterized protein n=1 Tax=Ameca splendens TaxID=208324 RepID=A0ABV0Z5S6_9TELE
MFATGISILYVVPGESKKFGNSYLLLSNRLYKSSGGQTKPIYPPVPEQPRTQMGSVYNRTCGTNFFRYIFVKLVYHLWLLCFNVEDFDKVANIKHGLKDSSR